MRTARLGRRDEQYRSAAREGVATVGRDEYGFRLDSPGAAGGARPVGVRYLREFNSGVAKKRPHGDWSPVHPVLGCEPDRAY